MELLYPQNGAIIELHSKEQDAFIERIASDGTDAALEWLSAAKQHTKQQEKILGMLKGCGIDAVRSWLEAFVKENEWTYSKPIKFQWETDSDESVFELAETAEFDKPLVVRTRDAFCEIRNLKKGQRYFWRVNNCAPFTFETADTFPRFIKIDGLQNVRDLGDSKIRQGILYRGSELCGVFNITDEGRRVFCEELGIKTELDLRGEWLNETDRSPAGDRVQLIQIPYRPYKEIFEEQHKKELCRIMEVLADAANYPVYFHCMVGGDRTGMLAMFLRAIAGSSEEEIHLDYDLTSLSSQGYWFNIEGYRRRTDPIYIKTLEMLEQYAPGEGLVVQIHKFLESCGVTKERIETIKAILIG